MKSALGFTFELYHESAKTRFERLFEVFQELIVHTSGDFDEAIDWLRMLDEEYKLTTADYTIDDFIKDLLDKGFIQERIDFSPEANNGSGEIVDRDDLNKGNNQGIGNEPGQVGQFQITEKTEQLIRKNALNRIFGNLRKGMRGQHSAKYSGKGDEHTGELREYQFGDDLSKLSMTESLRNAQINHGLGSFNLTEEDLVMEDTRQKANMSTALMIDISHSMILYGEDRITPAKRVAMALAEFISTRFPKDTLDILVFGNDAWQITKKELAYLKVGPFHTNTVAGLELAMDLLHKRRNNNKQIFMITDGKPSCVQMPDGRYYKNSFGLDDFIVGQCYDRAAKAKKLEIPITTFMITQDLYLQQFVDEFTKINNGKAFYTGLENLGDMIFRDFNTNRKKRFR